MYPFKVSRLIQWALSGFTWRIDRPGKNIYLTFDDGPIPEATPWVLRRLEDFGAKATFFCVGHNIEKHPRVFERMVKAGHTPANHTFNHLSGFDVSAEQYVENVWKAEKLIGTRLFRPPYGKITPRQYMTLKKDFKMVLCDVLSGDFDKNNRTEDLVQRTISGTENGSIILFHYSIKAIPRISEALPAVLRYFSDKGYSFRSLDFAFQNDITGKP